MGNTCSDEESESTATTQMLKSPDPPPMSESLPTRKMVSHDHVVRLTEVVPARNLSPHETAPLLQECIICYDDIPVQDAYWLPCSHVFHVQCIRRWFMWTEQLNIQKRPSRRCPICNHSVI